MTEFDVENILVEYGLSNIKTVKIIDNSIEGEFRQTYLIDQKYVLRIHQVDCIYEERLVEMDQLAKRYCKIQVLAPRLYKNKAGTFTTIIDERYVAYLSEYLSYETCENMEENQFYNVIYPQVLNMVGKFTANYINKELSNCYSMWTIEKLSPYDNEIDEKQENFNELIQNLFSINVTALVEKLVALNQYYRQLIRVNFDKLPKTVIQGDLNSSNILYQEDCFIGLIDFNMSGTEVNINYFVSETNGFPDFEQVNLENYPQFIEKWLEEQSKYLDIILINYPLNTLEKEMLTVYRGIGLISQYPNVQGYLLLLQKDSMLGIKFLEYLLEKIEIF